MIYTKYWKRDFQKISNKIWLWHKIAIYFNCEWARHQLSKWILFSSTMARKVHEAEKRDAKDLDELKQDGYFTWVQLDPAINGQKVQIYTRDNVLEDVQLGRHPLNNEVVDISTICNKIIHDRDWILWNDSRTHKIGGFAVSSESGDKQYVVSIKEWRKILSLCQKFYMEQE